MAEDRTFELYKLLVEEVRETKRARRELSNMFLSLNLGGVGALGFLARDGDGLNPMLFGLVAFALALTCLIWRTSNRYYTLLLDAKYHSIYEVEDQLAHRPIRAEYERLRDSRRVMKWATLERAMPWLFIVGYGAFFTIQVSDEHVMAWLEQSRAFLERLLRR